MSHFKIAHHPFLAIVLWLLFLCLPILGQATDSLRRLGFALTLSPGRVVALDKYTRLWLHENDNYSVAGEWMYQTDHSDQIIGAEEFGYPIIKLGVRYTYNRNVRLHRYKHPFWGMAQEVDYDSRLGNTLSLYTSFERKFFTRTRWDASVALSLGLGYSSRYYNPQDNVDDEFIARRLSVYFGAGLYATYHINEHWGLRGGLDFVHHSNGALARPNKGSNTIGPTLGVVYFPNHQSEKLKVGENRTSVKGETTTYLLLSVGYGGKTLLEDWHKTQFGTPVDAPNYRTDQFKFYPAYSLQSALMWHYSSIRSSGVGFDLFYGTHADHVARLDEADGVRLPHSPWSLGISAEHEVAFGPMRLALTLGYYLYRHMGKSAQANEKRYYERVGLFYAPTWMGGASLGLRLKAHLTQADFTEIALRYPIKFKKSHR